MSAPEKRADRHERAPEHVPGCRAAEQPAHDPHRKRKGGEEDDVLLIERAVGHVAVAVDRDTEIPAGVPANLQIEEFVLEQPPGRAAFAIPEHEDREVADEENRPAACRGPRRPPSARQASATLPPAAPGDRDRSAPAARRDAGGRRGRSPRRAAGTARSARSAGPPTRTRKPPDIAIVIATRTRRRQMKSTIRAQRGGEGGEEGAGTPQLRRSIAPSARFSTAIRLSINRQKATVASGPVTRAPLISATPISSPTTAR